MLADLIHFKNKTSISSKTFLRKIKDKVHPIQWWENAPSKLSPMAIRIMSVPATSASTERSFSQMQDVQKKKRHRLTIDRVGKLTFIALNNQLLSSSSPPKVMSNKRKLIKSHSREY